MKIHIYIYIYIHIYIILIYRDKDKVHEIGGFMGKTKMFRNRNSATSGFFKVTEPSAEEIGPPPVLPSGIIIISFIVCSF
jgi:hypothetical protein